MVNRIRSRFVKYRSMALALLTAVLLVSAVASAKEHKVKGSDNQAQAHVVAHISFSGLSTVDMAIQKKVNDKYYLYVQHSKDQGISIIDISKPAQPKAVGVIPWPDPALSSRMNLTGDLAIIAESEAPRVVQKFSGVVKWLQDERNFTYALNGDGLWVVSEPADRQAEQTAASNSYGG